MSFHYFYLFTRNFWNALTVSQLASVCIFQIISHLNLEKTNTYLKKKKKKLRAAFQGEWGGQILQLITNPACGPVRVFILWVNMQRLQRLKCSVKEKGGVQRKHCFFFFKMLILCFGSHHSPEEGSHCSEGALKATWVQSQLKLGCLST